MRVLVGESLPIGIAAGLDGFDASAVRAQRWRVVLVTRVRNRMRELRPLLPRIQSALAQVKKGEPIEIEGHERLS